MSSILKSSYSRSFVIAVALHAVVLFGGGWVLTQKAEFGMELGKSSLEVDLVAAAPEPQVVTPPPPPEKVEEEHRVEPVVKPPEPDDFIVPKKIEEEPKPVIEEPKVVEAPKPQPEKIRQVVKNTEPPPVKGDGSSPKPGRDSTTIHSTGGAVTEAKPDYLKNPPPRYPEDARRKGQEGVVLLSVDVSSEGVPEAVLLKTSSGFRSLDDAAIKAVKRWKFSPAKLGSMKIESQVDVPIRFQIEEGR